MKPSYKVIQLGQVLYQGDNLKEAWKTYVENKETALFEGQVLRYSKIKSMYYFNILKEDGSLERVHAPDGTESAKELYDTAHIICQIKEVSAVEIRFMKGSEKSEKVISYFKKADQEIITA